MATTVTIATIPALDAENVERTVVVTMTGAEATKLVRIRKGLIADSSVITGDSATLTTDAEALRFLIQEAAAAG